MKNNSKVVIISLGITLFLFSTLVIFRESFSYNGYELNTTYYVDDENKIIFLGSDFSTDSLISSLTFENDEEAVITDASGNTLTGNIYGEAFLNVRIDSDNSIQYRIVTMYLYPLYNEQVVENDKIIKYIELDTSIASLLNMIDLNFEYSMYVKRQDNVITDLNSTLLTGDKLIISFDNESFVEYTLSVVGDVTGNGVFDLNDVVSSSRYLVGWINPRNNSVYTLNLANKYAIDITKNSLFDLNDVVSMNRIIVGIRQYSKTLHVGDEILGDSNIDGVVDGRDIIRLTRYLAGKVEFSSVQLMNSDLNSDNNIDDTDVIILKRHLNNVSGYENLPYLGEVLPEDPGFEVGDVNMDGVVDNQDVAVIDQYLSSDRELSADELVLADVNQDGDVDRLDKYIINCKSSGLISHLPYTEPIMFGDLNGDGNVDGNDITILSQFLSDIGELTNVQRLNSDVNMDLIINESDLIILRRYVLQSDGYSSLPYLGEVLPDLTNAEIGDVNLDGLVNNSDSLVIGRYLNVEIELTEYQLSRADVNQDNDVSVLDKYIIDLKNAGYSIFSNLPYTEPIAFGDINNDGNIDNDDIGILTDYINELATLSEIQLVRADVNIDLLIDENDLLILSSYVNHDGNIYDLPHTVGDR